MVQLIDVTEENWIDIARLSVSDEQQAFLDRPLGIIARGYVYRNCNAPALRVYEKVGFVDTGYIDDDVPDCLNLMYHFQ